MIYCIFISLVLGLVVTPLPIYNIAEQGMPHSVSEHHILSYFNLQFLICWLKGFWVKFITFMSFIKTSINLNFHKFYRKFGKVPTINWKNSSLKPVKNTPNMFIIFSTPMIINKVSTILNISKTQFHAYHN